jgi:hypothetical protein
MLVLSLKMIQQQPKQNTTKSTLPAWMQKFFCHCQLPVEQYIHLDHEQPQDSMTKIHSFRPRITSGFYDKEMT